MPSRDKRVHCEACGRNYANNTELKRHVCKAEKLEKVPGFNPALETLATETVNRGTDDSPSWFLVIAGREYSLQEILDDAHRGLSLNRCASNLGLTSEMFRKHCKVNYEKARAVYARAMTDRTQARIHDAENPSDRLLEAAMRNVNDWTADPARNKVEEQAAKVPLSVTQILGSGSETEGGDE